MQIGRLANSLICRESRGCSRTNCQRVTGIRGVSSLARRP